MMGKLDNLRHRIEEIEGRLSPTKGTWYLFTNEDAPSVIRKDLTKMERSLDLLKRDFIALMDHLKLEFYNQPEEKKVRTKRPKNK